MQTRFFNIARKITVLTLVAALVFGSFFNVRKADAAIPLVAGGAAAIAAEATALGITSEALMTALVAIAAAGTGVYLVSSTDANYFISDQQWGRLWNGSDLGYGDVNNWDTEYQKWKFPGSENKSWDDLTQEEKNQYGSPAGYVQAGYLGLALQFPDLFQIGSGGDLEPTPEPENDPNGSSRWQKMRNVVIALGSGLGAVALNDAIGPWVDSLAAGVKGFLFGTGNDGLGLVFNLPPATVSGHPVTYANIPVYGSYATQNNWMYYYYSSSIERLFNTTTPKTYKLYWSGSGWQTASAQSANIQEADRINGTVTSYGSNRSTTIWSSTNNYLNPSYYGTYEFYTNSSFNTKVASLTSGSWTGTVTLGDPSYGQFSDTPSEVADYVNDSSVSNYITSINNYTTDTGIADSKRTVQIPSNMFDGSNPPTYIDFVDITPEDDITPIPDDTQINPNPEPTPEQQFQQDLGQRVMQLLAQPFDQLFPFCLIGDMRRISEILSNVAYSNESGMRSQSEETINGTDVFVIPLSDFNVEGLEDFELDLVPIADLAHEVRPFMTALFICGLLAGTLKFFINRGGE